MFDIESRKAFTLSMDEFQFWLAVNTDEGFSSAMPYYTSLLQTDLQVRQGKRQD